MQFIKHTHPLDSEDLQQILQIGLWKGVCELFLNKETDKIVVSHDGTTYEFDNSYIYLYEVLESLDLAADSLEIEYSDKGYSAFDMLLTCVRDIGLAQGVLRQPDYAAAFGSDTDTDTDTL